MAAKNIGIQVSVPKEECDDKNCPFHGVLICRGNSFEGVVVSSKMHRTATVEWKWLRYIPKYERYESKKTRVKAHNSPCINAKEGEIVKIIGCRPLSKTKNFVIVEKLGTDVDYIIKRETMKADEETVSKKNKDNIAKEKESENAAS
nr:30S ribosomal protein S17P [uncultured archaeon]